jgi:hypothetical protein
MNMAVLVSDMFQEEQNPSTFTSFHLGTCESNLITPYNPLKVNLRFGGTSTSSSGSKNPQILQNLLSSALICRTKTKLRGLSPQARTTPTEPPPLAGEVSANFSG